MAAFLFQKFRAVFLRMRDQETQAIEGGGRQSPISSSG